MKLGGVGTVGGFVWKYGTVEGGGRGSHAEAPRREGAETLRLGRRETAMLVLIDPPP